MERFFRYLLPVLFVALLLTGAITSLIFQHNLKNQLKQDNLKLLMEVKTDLDVMLAPQEKYRLIDTDNGYLARIRPMLLTGHARSEAELQSLSSALRFLDAAKATEGAVHSIYVALADPDVPYILTESGMRYKKFLRDRTWLTAIESQPVEDFCEFRNIQSGSADGSVDLQLLTVYHHIQSTHWNTGEQVGGYVVINYYLTPVMMQLMRTLPSSHSIYIAESHNGQFFVSGRNSILTEHELLTLTKTAEQIGEFKNSNGEYVYFRASSDKLSIDYILLCPKQVLFQLVADLNLAMLLLTGALIALSLMFFLVYQYQQRKYISNIRHILAVSNDGSVPTGMLRFPHDDYSYITHHILKHTVDRIELNGLLQKEQSTRMEMEMLALQSQINPHFLLNTIDFLYWGQVRDFGVASQQVSTMENLCKILKYALDSSHTFVRLRDELSNASCYIEIQRARKNLILDILYQIPDELMDAGVMKLILQPILENVFQHGIDRLGKRKLAVNVTAKREGEYLLLLIADDGLGMEEDERIHINQELRNGVTKNAHIGIANINRRLMLSYGGDAGVFLSANHGGGLIVTIKMKYTKLDT